MNRMSTGVLMVVVTMALTGCNTVGGTVKGASEGAKSDAKTAVAWGKKSGENIQKTDDWIQKNLW